MGKQWREDNGDVKQWKQDNGGWKTTIKNMVKQWMEDIGQ